MVDKDNTKEAYTISNYDLIYILLKPSSHSREDYKDFIKHDKARDKYFLIGKVVEAEGYPRYRTITFVPEKHISDFKKAKKFIDKKEYLINVHFNDIDFITLPFDSFDWK